MARITNEQADKYYSGGSSEWFQLKNDGNVARVQFMFDSIEDIPTFSTHRIKLGDKERQVDCLRMPGDPIEKCPLCEAGIPARAARFVIMYQLDDQKVKIWERGRQFISKLQGLINRYSPLSEHVFEIERHGRAGDQSTKYEIYPVDNVQAEDVSQLDKPELEGSLVLQKTVDEMNEYLETGEFSSEGDGAPVRRRGSSSDNAASYTPRRQTPATTSTSGATSSRTGRAQHSSSDAPQGRRGSRRAVNPEETF